jgi:hypothetical protein
MLFFGDVVCISTNIEETGKCKEEWIETMTFNLFHGGEIIEESLGKLLEPVEGSNPAIPELHRRDLSFLYSQ